MTRARLIAAFVLAGGLLFLLFGGEYGTGDWLELRRLVRAEELRTAELGRAVDSLEKVAVALEKDPRVQERTARELFGMLRPGEHLYRLVPPDTAEAR